MDDLKDPQTPDEIVEGTVETPSSDGSGAMVMMNLESMIKSHISSIDRMQDELDKHSSMLQDIFDNDPTFKEHSDRAKEAAKVKSTTKAQILKQPQAADLNSKVKSFKSQIKEMQEALLDYLSEYQRMSGVNEIEGEDGEVREIILVPKLIKKSSVYR
jgi:hypothetical protein